MRAVFRYGAGSKATILLNRNSSIKLCWIIFISLGLTHLVLSLVLKTSTTRLSNAAIAIGFAVSPMFAFLSYQEHNKSQRPSTILNLYLLGSIPMDAARARTLFHMPGNKAIAIVFTTLVVCKSVLFILEATEKRSLMARILPPEQTAGILNLTAFWWFNPQLRAGYKRTLKFNDLLRVDEDISLEKSKEEIRQKWKHGNEALSDLNNKNLQLISLFLRRSFKRAPPEPPIGTLQVATSGRCSAPSVFNGRQLCPALPGQPCDELFGATQRLHEHRNSVRLDCSLRYRLRWHCCKLSTSETCRASRSRSLLI